jgi:hypothetical protein
MLRRQRLIGTIWAAGVAAIMVGERADASIVLRHPGPVAAGYADQSAIDREVCNWGNPAGGSAGMPARPSGMFEAGDAPGSLALAFAQGVEGALLLERPLVALMVEGGAPASRANRPSLALLVGQPDLAAIDSVLVRQRWTAPEPASMLFWGLIGLCAAGRGWWHGRGGPRLDGSRGVGTSRRTPRPRRPWPEHVKVAIMRLIARGGVL